MEIKKAYKQYTNEGISFVDAVPMTKQAFKAECDINNILVKYQKTGVFDHVKKYEGQYFDSTETDYQEALNTVINANDMFDELPSKAREYFHNDPARFLAFFDSYNEDAVNKLRELGLAVGTRSNPTNQIDLDKNNVPDVQEPLGDS